MNDNGLPAVDGEKCTACGDCVDACPRDLFKIMPLSQKLLVQCNTPLAGEAVSVLCSVGCDGCGKCAADAEPGLIEMKDELPLIHYESGLPITPKPTLRCPTGAIQWVEGDQFLDLNESNDNRKRYAQLH
jgi:ferredoxin